MKRKIERTEPNYLRIGLEVLAIIAAFNVAATFVFYYFIAPYMG